MTQEEIYVAKTIFGDSKIKVHQKSGGEYMLDHGSILGFSTSSEGTALVVRNSGGKIIQVLSGDKFDSISLA